MKKSNLITSLSFVGLIAIIILFMVFWKTPSADIIDESTDNSAISEIVQTQEKETGTEKQENNTSEKINSTESNPTSSVKQQTKKENESKSKKTETSSSKNFQSVSMNNSLFIGDSRTVGLMEYSKIKDANFFSYVGMSVYNIFDKTVSVPNIGKVTLSELLSNKKYSKIYIMLGVNEIGYNLNGILSKYKELIKFVQKKQPGAVVIIEANLHVTKSRSNSDKIVNNKAINKLNSSLSKLADGKKIFYIDCNELFDDENGNLSAEKSEDNTHLYAKYYSEWGRWIEKQTALLTGEE